MSWDSIEREQQRHFASIFAVVLAGWLNGVLLLEAKQDKRKLIENLPVVGCLRTAAPGRPFERDEGARRR